MHTLKTTACALAALAAFALPAPASDIDWATVTPTPRRPAIVTEQAPAGAAAAPALAYDLEAQLEPFPGAMPLESITAEHMNERVVVDGRILQVRESRSERMPVSLMIREQPPLWVIYYPAIAEEVQAGRGVPVVGQRVTARGVVNEFQGQLQVRANSSADIVLQGTGRTVGGIADEILAGAEPDVATAARSLWEHRGVAKSAELRAHLGSQAVVAGAIEAIRLPWSDTAPTIVTVKDATGSVDLVFWARDEAAKPQGLEVGKLVLARGNVEEFQGRTQLNLGNRPALRPVEARSASAQIEALGR